jgi:hypothetical protein
MTSRRTFVFWLAATWLAAAGLVVAAAALAREPATGSAAELLAKRMELQPALRDSPFGEPLVMTSKEQPDRVQGDVYAELSHSFDTVSGAFRTPAAVCELLFLHLNVRSCQPVDGGVALVAGPKKSGGAGMTVPMRYSLRTEVDLPGHLRVVLTAPTGPLATTDYRMVFEAVGIESARSFVHFGYAHSLGALARLAMGAYLATAGRDKIGFTVTGRDAAGRPEYVRGERASLERNVMRYYLALLAHCRERSGSPDERMQARLRTWFALTERHAAQLHEYGLGEYLAEKQRDLARKDGSR